MFFSSVLDSTAIDEKQVESFFSKLTLQKLLYAAVLLVHDVLLFLSAAAVSLILVEYMVKGCVITLKQSFFQGWICYVAVYAAAYLICGIVRIGVCLGMAISMIHGMIDHYVMLFRGTPVMLSDIAAIGTAANVSKGYSAPMELSVRRAAAAARTTLPFLL